MLRVKLCLKTLASKSDSTETEPEADSSPPAEHRTDRDFGRLRGARFPREKRSVRRETRESCREMAMTMAEKERKSDREESTSMERARTVVVGTGALDFWHKYKYNLVPKFSF